ASVGNRTLISVAAAIPLLAAVAVLVGISFRDEPPEDELTGTLPISPSAGGSDVQSVQFALMSAPSANDVHVTITSPASDAEPPVEGSGVSWEFVPSPRPRPEHKSRQRRVHKMRNVLTNAVAILPPGPVEVQPLHLRLALMRPPPTSETDTSVQS